MIQENLKRAIVERQQFDRRKIIREFCDDMDRRIVERRTAENSKISKWLEIFERAKAGRG